MPRAGPDGASRAGRAHLGAPPPAPLRCASPRCRLFEGRPASFGWNCH
ncbi:MAG: hypothetical protein LBT98_00080 [Puniceicoccales bacterium]|nr:hypothetical protein [Puniceicoccales bacterium]